MRVPSQFLTLPLLMLLATPSFARPVPVQLLQARQLNEQGQSRAAIELLEPLVQSESHLLSGADLGIAWILLGSAYKDFELYNKARRCYEAAIPILRALPDEQVQYASALDNLGAVEAASGHVDSSKALRTRARSLYQATGNHAGIAITSSNLALIAVNQNDLSAARKDIAEAFREAQLTKDLSDHDLATMYSVKSVLAIAEQDFSAAIAADQQAIDVWTRGHGPRFYMQGMAYALRGQAYDRLGNHQQAVSDLQHALELLQEIPGRNAPAYLTIKLAYAHALRDAGSKQEASRLEKEARAAQANIRTQQCSGCTISAESFR